MNKPLRNPKHERFCREIVFGKTHPKLAYVQAGFEPNRANHNRLIRDPRVKARIDELTRQCEMAERAARTPIADIITELLKHGVERVVDFFDNGPAGELVVRDLRSVRAEVALALLESLCDGFGIRWDRPQEPRLPAGGRDVASVATAELRHGQ